ncbi:MAG: FKBP-type peptidyl-prolyl cis-trans isomerase, partial [Firmicutes bacterium]|nr:FKBP-type peptidyl-prolyl cis-trans isomerase [Bacillota bacterium]
MKKFTAVLMIALLAVCFMTGCGEEKVTPNLSPYDTLDYAEYVELPDYMSFDFKAEPVEVTDEQVQAEIDSRLKAASTETNEITEGKVEKGDTVRISFKGTLEDGSSPEGMNSDGYELTLGEASMIDGFQEGIYGATIGEPVTLDLQFPDPYTMNEELSGKPVTFEVTVLAKIETIQQELDEEFIKKDSEDKATNEEEYRDYIMTLLQA